MTTVLLLSKQGSTNANASNKINLDVGKYRISKISHPDRGEGKADGLYPAEGDRNNSYAWSMTEINDKVFIGSNRSLLFMSVVGIVKDVNLAKVLMAIISKGDVPTDSKDTRANIMTYNKTTGKMDLAYTSELDCKGNPIDTGYRNAITFTAKGDEKPSAYFGTVCATNTRVLKFKDSFDSTKDKPEVVFSADSGKASIRSMALHENKLYIGSLIVDKDLRILESDNPSKDNWKVIATLKDFQNLPAIDGNSVAMGGVWDLVSYNGYLYAFLGSGNTPKNENEGFMVFKGKYIGEGQKGANAAGWKWNMVVGKEGKYPAGLGNPVYSAATPYKYTTPEGKEYVYVGTFSYPINALINSLLLNYNTMYEQLMAPTQLYRFNENDQWELVVGNPSKDGIFKDKVGNLNGGFLDPKDTNINASTNQYVWKMASYNGKLFLGTFDAASLYDYVIPPKLSCDPKSLATLQEMMPTLSQYIDPSMVNLFMNQMKSSNPLSFSADSILSFIRSYINEENIDELKGKLELYLKDKDISQITSEDLIKLSMDYAKPDKCEKLKTTIKAIIDNVKKMMAIRNIIDSSKKGFDLFVTEDGKNFNKISDNGFNDKFNYGVRTLLPSKDGLYLGTANPYYGCQLWKINEKSLYLNNLAVSTGTLAPEFNSNKFAYEVNVKNSVSSISVLPTAEDMSSTIKVNGKITESGTYSAPIALVVGNNEIEVKVTNLDGESKSYIVKVIRGPEEVTPPTPNPDPSNPGNNNGNNNSNNGSNNNSSTTTLPQTGGPIGFNTLIFFSLLITCSGFVLLKKSPKY